MKKILLFLIIFINITLSFSIPPNRINGWTWYRGKPVYQDSIWVEKNANVLTLTARDSIVSDTLVLDGQSFGKGDIGSGSPLLEGQTLTPATPDMNNRYHVGFLPYTQTAAFQIGNPINTSGWAVANGTLKLNGTDSVSFGTLTKIIRDDYNADKQAKTYTWSLFRTFNGDTLNGLIVLADSPPTLTVTPTIDSGVIANNNSYLEVYTNVNIYGANDGTTPVDLNDFIFSFDVSGGTATNITFDSLRTTTGSVIIGGSKLLRFYLTVTGTADGNETVTVQPKADSIYNVDAIVMASGETTGPVNLIDETIPQLATPTFDSIVVLSDSSFKIAWTDNNTSPNEDSTQIQYDTVNTFNSAIVSSIYAAQDATLDTIFDLLADTKYYVRIRAIGDGTTKTTSNWSSTLSDTTQATEENDILALGSVIRYYDAVESGVDTVTGGLLRAWEDISAINDSCTSAAGEEFTFNESPKRVTPANFKKLRAKTTVSVTKGNFTFVFMCDRNGEASPQYMFAADAGETAGLYFDTDTNVIMTTGLGNVIWDIRGVSGRLDKKVWMVVSDGNNQSLYHDNTLVSTQTLSGTGTFTFSRISSLGTNTLDGDIFSWIVRTELSSSSDRTTIYNYLNTVHP